MNKYIEEKQGSFNSTIDFFKKEISSLRTGRANPSVLDSVLVDSYGVKSPLNAVSSITVPDGHSIVLSPWDKSVLKEIEKAVVEADLGFGVVNEGDKVRLSVPKMTEENRLDIVKKLNERQELSRIAIRKIRDEIKSEIEQAEKDKEINEDDKFRFIKDLDIEVAKQNEILKSIRDKKEADIMTI
jgi:ribosome recycling factor